MEVGSSSYICLSAIARENPGFLNVGSLVTKTRESPVSCKTSRITGRRASTSVGRMSSGVITEQGTHEELTANSGQYAALWKVQTGIR
ncbi:MAG: hypothetical protein ACFFDI_01450 [Promethearchaeota archaeon]